MNLTLLLLRPSAGYKKEKTQENNRLPAHAASPVLNPYQPKTVVP